MAPQDVNCGRTTSRMKQHGKYMMPHGVMEILARNSHIDETIYFSLLNSTYGTPDLWAHDTSNGSTWCVEDFYAISNYYGLHRTWYLLLVICLPVLPRWNAGYELWAYDTSNYSTWQVTDINDNTGPVNAYPGGSTDSSQVRSVHSILVGDTIYFRATVTPYPYTYEMWAHDTSNQSTWRVTSGINSVATSNTSALYSSLALTIQSFGYV